jgi:pantothenate synthetase
MCRVVAGEPLVQLDYAVAVDADHLVGCGHIEDPASVRLLIAAQVGPVRLIDNCAGAVVAESAIPTPRRAARQLERIG